MTARICRICKRVVTGDAVPLVDSATWSATSSYTPVVGLVHLACLNPARSRLETHLDGWDAIAAHCHRSPRWCRYMGIPVTKLGGTIRIAVAELDAWLATSPRSKLPSAKNR